MRYANAPRHCEKKLLQTVASSDMLIVQLPSLSWYL